MYYISLSVHVLSLHIQGIYIECICRSRGGGTRAHKVGGHARPDREERRDREEVVVTSKEGDELSENKRKEEVEV